ncbi:MAG TPA: thioredoxin family protein, partial [Micromonosporaceae bacterium]
TAVGWLLRQRDGKFRGASGTPAAGGTSAASTSAGGTSAANTSTDANTASIDAASVDDAATGAARLAPVLPLTRTEPAIDPVLAELGVRSGEVTLLQFSSAFCAPCRATRVLCADVAATLPGVRHLDVDAESQLDAVRALQIWRTPTVLLIDAAGTVHRRATGAPSRAQLLAAVAEVLPQADLGASRRVG